MPAQKTLVALVDGLGPEYIERSEMPNLRRLVAGGIYKVGRSVIPSVTNVNNASVVTGSFPSEHGIVSNFYFDPHSGESVMMESADFLLRPTLFERAAEAGLRPALVTAKNKIKTLLARGGVEDLGDGMSAAWFDYDGDGRPDLYVSNLWSDAGQRVVSQKKLQPGDVWRRHAKGNSLYQNRGDGTFEEKGAMEGVEMGRWAWSSDGIDFDNDGTPEILITAGMLTNVSETDLESFFWRKVAAASPESEKPEPTYENGWNALSQAAHERYSEAGRQPNVFYVRRGSRYYDFSGVSGLDFAEDSRAFAATDLDGDGNLDLLLKSRLGPQVRVFRNHCGTGRKCLAVRLRGVISNRDGIGARVEVDGKVKFLQAGSGYLSQHTKQLHFGLGRQRRVVFQCLRSRRAKRLSSIVTASGQCPAGSGRIARPFEEKPRIARGLGGARVRRAILAFAPRQAFFVDTAQHRGAGLAGQRYESEGHPQAPQGSIQTTVERSDDRIPQWSVGDAFSTGSRVAAYGAFSACRGGSKEIAGWLHPPCLADAGRPAGEYRPGIRADSRPLFVDWNQRRPGALRRRALRALRPR